MKKVTELLERYLMPIGAKLAANKALNAIGYCWFVNDVNCQRVFN